MKKILDIIQYALIVLTMLLIIIFQNKIFNVFIIVSSFCFLLGIIHIIEKKNTWILLEIISITSLISIILYKKNILSFGDTVTFYVCMILSTTLIAAVILAIIQISKLNKIYSQKVIAKVIDYDKVENTKINYVYPIYSYFIGKKEYCVISPQVYKKNIPKIDSELTIYVNPDDVEDVHFRPSNVKTIFYLIAGIITAIACIMVIIYLFK